ncbi:Hsp20/alpha crystallin family protein [Bacillus suaedae]|uniref:Hsp20/alpha crystallin family protein n=1 Tax=Halalkalibacter suaedae TaxID=2822140 RepID=A0A941APV9_9BACI|nr:Hsp20/alpha crystallin family protein [Bacillus suaedae]MBP3953200.1 Hsp20/alpha crystallin family protein [Bacillus suaedae]
MNHQQNRQQYHSTSYSTNKSNHQNQVEIRTPKIDLFETDEHFYLRLSLPGVNKEKLKIFFNDEDHLVIQGIVSTNVPENIVDIVAQEIFQGPFKRTVQLPSAVDKQSIKFLYDRGILEIFLQKLV